MSLCTWHCYHVYPILQLYNYILSPVCCFSYSTWFVSPLTSIFRVTFWNLSTILSGNAKTSITFLFYITLTISSITFISPLFFTYFRLWIIWIRSIVGCVSPSDQGRLSSIIGPQAQRCTEAATYSTTDRDNTVNVDNIKHIFIVLVLPTKSVFKH